MNKDAKKIFEDLKLELNQRASYATDLYPALKEAVIFRSYKGQTIFKIDIYTIDRETIVSDEELARIHFVPPTRKWVKIADIDRYPFTPLYLMRSIYCIDESSIIDLIKQETNKRDSRYLIQYFFVTQFPCDRYIRMKEPYAGYPSANYISMCSYDYNGDFVNTTAVSSPGFGKMSRYHGRLKDQIRFKQGDVVEVADLYKCRGEPCIKIGRVMKTPLDTIDECLLTYGRFDNNYLSDAYKIAVFDPESKELKRRIVPAINVFHPRFPISKDIINILTDNNRTVHDF